MVRHSAAPYTRRMLIYTFLSAMIAINPDDGSLAGVHATIITPYGQSDNPATCTTSAPADGEKPANCLNVLFPAVVGVANNLAVTDDKDPKCAALPE
jgi:hypothetical protein